jgi:hypothetical protein
MHLLADGRHRYAATVLANRSAIMSEVHEGNYNECLKYALLSNSTHGLQRSPSDKRQCVIASMKQWPDASNVHIASLCDVDDKTVASVREYLEQKKVIPKTEVRVGKDGRSYDVKTKREVTPKAASSKEVKDPLGRIIPTAVLKYWNRAEEPKILMKSIDEVAKHLKSASDHKDPMYGELHFQGVMADLGKVMDNLKTVIPYCVCTLCQGHPEMQPKGECRLCYGRGLISKFRYDVLVTKETKAIVEKGGKKK